MDNCLPLNGCAFSLHSDIYNMKPRYGPSSAFLMNIFFALKGSKLFILICYHCSRCCAVWRSQKVSPHSSLVQNIFYFGPLRSKNVF